MGVRLFALALLGFIFVVTGLLWPALMSANLLVKAGMVLVYGTGVLLAIYGIVTGKAP